MSAPSSYHPNMRIFISYRRKRDSETKAHKLYQILQDRDYDPFLDTLTIEPGDNWSEKIYDSVREADVLVILITSESDTRWLQREVDIARGSLVSILPVKVAADDDIHGVLRQFGLSHTQYTTFPETDAAMERFIHRIRDLSTITRDAQRRHWHTLDQKRHTMRAAANELHHATFSTGKDANAWRVHLATGDMTKFRDIDVLVNTENDYMQMARVFENMTLSSTLRWEGSLIEGGRLLEDTVQLELNAQVAATMGGMLPIMPEQVLVTQAGHPDSKLITRNRARFIFHVATVQVSAHTQREKLTPLANDQSIHRAVQNCLEMVNEVDHKRGVISPASSDAYAKQMEARETYKPIKSIMLPMFGTGIGGRRVDEVVQPMIAAIEDFISEYRNDTELLLRDIYLCIYSQLDVETVERAMQRILYGWDFQKVDA